DDPLPRADLGNLQLDRLHHRYLVGRLREAPSHTAPHHHAAHLSRRQLLLHRHAAALLADGVALQPRGLPGERIPLELLRPRRRERGAEPRHDRGVSRGVARGGGVDLQDRLPAEELKSSIPLTNGGVLFNLWVKYKNGSIDDSIEHVA